MTGLRVGHGYDVHRLAQGRPLILGGVTIPWEKGLDGHSDADVLTHAVMDALLGAAGMDDIGKLFPDCDNAFLNISSLTLLERVMKALQEFLRPEFINRVDEIVYFHQLTEENFRGIAGIMLEELKAALEEKGRLHWLDHDFEELSDPARYEANERERFRRLKRVSQLSRRQLSAAREVAAWRELEAQRRDVPRKWVVTDEQIVEACKREARTIDELFMVRGLSDRLSTKDARAVVSLISSALSAPPDTWPELDRCGKSEPNVDAELDLMSALVRLRAKENGIAFPTLASHDDLARVARGYREGVDLLRGWRRAIVGEELLELLDGRLTLSLDGGLKVERREGPGAA